MDFVYVIFTTPKTRSMLVLRAALRDSDVFCLSVRLFVRLSAETDGGRGLSCRPFGPH